MTNKELREKVYEMCDLLGVWNIHPKIVAEELNTAHSNVSRWKKQWIELYGLPQIKRFGMELSANFLTALKELMKLAKHQNPKIRIEAIKALFDCQEKFTKFLEAFGYKDKVPPVTDTDIHLYWGPKEDSEDRS